MYDILVSHCTRKFLGAVDHLLDLLCNRNTAYEVLLLIDLKHLCCKILSIAVSKFLYCINAGSLKKFCKLRAIVP